MNHQMMRVFSVFGTASVVLSLAVFLILKNRLRLTGKKAWITFGLLAFGAVIGLAGPIIYRANVSAIDFPPAFTLQFTQYLFIGWLLTTFLILLIAEVAERALWIVSWARAKSARRSFDPSKRIFLTETVTKGLLATTSFTTLAGLVEAGAGPKIVPVTIQLKTLPQSFDGLTIAQISDMHVGSLLHEGFVSGVVNQVMSLKPDVIFITGDLVDGSVPQLKHHLEPLRELKAKDGIYFVTGNHEYYSGVEAWIEYLNAMGIHVFENSNVILTRKFSSDSTYTVDQSLMIAGVYDFQAEKYSDTQKTDPALAASTDTPVACKILMAHNPLSIEGAASAGFDLQVSGHTHAGQFYPFAWIAKLYLKHFEGLYQFNDKTQLYVNRGTGFWGPPNRLGKMSEITHYTLKRAPQA
jgi:predicted MPP superfamily phosphohydrolase